ncbi:MAG: hypothetical protein Q4C78_02510 [Synergistaceae bacterium]|nr:hypothetical protein [Synergistaceae bacterium]
MFLSKSSSHRGFTILEILLAFAITLPAIFIISRTIATVSDSYWRMLDRRIATSRANSVFALLKQPLYHAGFAMLSGKEFSSHFFSSITEPFSWGWAISCVTNEKIRIFYALPLYTLVKNNISTDAGSCAIDFTSAIDANKFSVSAYNIKSYVILKSANIDNKVFRITSATSNYIRVISQTDSSYSIGKNDMVMGLRAIEASANNGIFYTNDFRTSGVQPRIDGIWKIHFVYDEIKRLVTVTLIATGDRECDTPRVEGKEILPSELIDELSSLLAKTKRNLFCYKRSFFLANLN